LERRRGGFVRRVELQRARERAHRERVLALPLIGEPEVIVRRRVVRVRLDDYDGAIACFEHVVEANPDDASAHYHLGLSYERQGNEALAMSALTRALQLDPSDEAAASALQELQR
jgi:tetratricopeptide (TPR) repeat protein